MSRFPISRTARCLMAATAAALAVSTLIGATSHEWPHLAKGDPAFDHPVAASSTAADVIDVAPGLSIIQ